MLRDNGIAGSWGGSILTLRLGPAGLTLTPLFFEGLGEGICVSSPVQSGVADLHGGGGGGLGRQLTNIQSHLRRTNERTDGQFHSASQPHDPLSRIAGERSALAPRCNGKKSNHHGGERVMLSRRHVSPRNTSFI